MNAGRKILFLSLTGFAVLLSAACTTSAPVAKGLPTVLIALQIPGGGRPTPQQIATVDQMLAGFMDDKGLQLADSAEKADFILSATFTPDPVDPSRGHLTVHNLEAAPNTKIDFGEMRSRIESAAGDLQAWGMSHSAPEH